MYRYMCINSLYCYICVNNNIVLICCLNNYIHSKSKVEKKKRKLETKETFFDNEMCCSETFQKVTTLEFCGFRPFTVYRSVWSVSFLYVDEFAFICTLICIPVLSPSLLPIGPWILFNIHEIKAGTKNVALIKPKYRRVFNIPHITKSTDRPTDSVECTQINFIDRFTVYIIRLESSGF